MRTRHAQRMPGHRAPWFLDRIFASVCLPTARMSSARSTFSTGTRTTSRPLSGNPSFELMRHTNFSPCTSRSPKFYNLACPSPRALPFDPWQLPKVGAGATTCSDSPSGSQSEDPAGIPRRGLRSIRSAPATEAPTPLPWGHVNPYRIPLVLRRGKRCAETLFFDTTRHTSC